MFSVEDTDSSTGGVRRSSKLTFSCSNFTPENQENRFFLMETKHRYLKQRFYFSFMILG